jgi:predicted membrane protein
MNNRQTSEIRNLTLAAMLLALGIVLPTLTGPQLGSQLLPMHIPAILAGLVLGPKYGLIVGFTTPLLRSVTFGMPPLLPAATAMAFEIGTYGFIAGLIYCKVKENVVSLYASLLSAMLIGRVVCGIAMFILLAGFGLGPGVYSLSVWVTSVFISSWVGIVAHLIIIPLIIVALERSGLMRKRNRF